MKIHTITSLAFAFALAATPTLGLAKDNIQHNAHQGSCKMAWGQFLKNGWWNNTKENSISENCRIPFGIFKKIPHATSTPDTVAPVINSFTVDARETKANVLWNTNENVRDAVVFYGTTTPEVRKATSTTEKDFLKVVSTTNGSAYVVDDTDNKATGSIALKDLTASTTYYAVLAVRDRSGNVTISAVQSFKTDSTNDATAPVISAITTSINLNKLIVSWKTNEPATSTLFYGTSTINLATATRLHGDTLKTSHVFELPLLSSTTPRHIVLQSADASGNVSTSPEYTVYSPF